jgi:hypothetical protein
MSELLKKYESIDQSKLNEATIKIINRVKTITADFTADDEKNNKIAEQVLDSVMQKNPDAVKIVKREPKAKPAPKKTHKATHTAKKAHTAKATHTTSSAPKTSNNIMSVAKEIQKAGESWKDAMERAKEVLKERRGEVVQKQKTELEKLYNLVKTKKELQGFANSDIKRDAVRTAKVKGARFVSKEGSTSNAYGTFPNKIGRKYWETRDRHSDRLAPNYPKNMPLLANGGSVNMNKHIWEGWTVGSFIEELEPQFNQIMSGGSWKKPFKTKEEVKAWCMDNQPYYKKNIPEVVNYFWAKAQSKDDNGYYTKGGGVGSEKYRAGQKFYDTRYDRVCEIVPSNYDGMVSWKRYNKSGTEFENETKHSLVENQFDYLVDMGAYQISKQSMANGGGVSQKKYNTQFNIGESKYVVNYHDGVKKHKDGSNFYDIAIFKNKKDFEAFLTKLSNEGYREMGYNSSFEEGGIFYKEGSDKYGLGNTEIFIQEENDMYCVYDNVWNEENENWEIKKIADFDTMDEAKEFAIERSKEEYANGGQIKNLISIMNSKYFKNGMSLKDLHDETIMYLGKEQGGLVFQEFIKENKGNEKLMKEFNKTSFADGGSLPFMTDPNFGNFQNTGSFAKGGEFALYKIQQKFKYAIQPKWEDEKIQTGGRKFLTFKQAQDFKKKLQNAFDWSMEYKVVKVGEDEKLADGGSLPFMTDPNFGNFQNTGSFADGGSMSDLTEQEFLKKYFGANVFTENPSQYFEIKKMSSSDDNKVDAFVKELKADGFTVKKRAFSDFTSVMGVKKKSSFELGGAFMMTDLAGHTGGSDGLGNPMPLSGVSGTHYTGLVGETGAMSSGELFEAGGALYSAYTDNPLKYLSLMGAKTYGDLNYSTSKNGIDYHIGRKKDKNGKNKAIVVAFITDENNYMIEKEDAKEMSETAKEKGVDRVELYTNYGVEIRSSQKPQFLGFDKIVKVIGNYELGGAMMQNQQVINDASQSYVNYYLNDGGGVFKDGGSIPNNYEGRTPEDIWNNWTSEQKIHFMQDHKYNIFGDRQISKEDRQKFLMTKFKDLSRDLRIIVEDHVQEVQYAYGGRTKSRPSMRQLYIEQIADLTNTREVGVDAFAKEHNLTDSELSNLMSGLGRKMISQSDFITALVGNKNNPKQKEVVAFAKSDKAYKMADGGFMSGVYAKGGMLNKKVNDELNFYLGDVINDVPMSQWIIKTILKSALTDANFHNASKEVDSIFTKAKYTESAQFSKLQEDAITKRLESKGRDIAKMCDYDAFEIIDSIAFYVSMNMGRPLGEKIENLKNIFADGGSTDEVAKIKVSSPDGKYVDVWYITKDTDTTHFYISNSPESKGMAYHVGQFRSEVFYDDLRSWLKGGSNINGNEYKSNSYANGGSFEDNYGFMRADNENNYRFPERPVHVDTLDEPIDLTDNVSYKSNEVVIEPVDQDMNMNEDGRIRARMTQSNRGSAENFAKINPNSFEFIPMPTSNKHKND